MPERTGPRGIDYIGITVPDIEAATRFLTEALGAQPLYDTQAKAGGPPREGSDVEARLGLAPGGRVFAIRMLRLHNGPGIELFEMTAPDQRPAARPSDLGLQHVALYVDDLEAATVRFAAAGGQLLTGPHALPPPEGGEGNAFRYGRAPWGMVIEFLTYPSPQPYRERTELRRWTPRP